MRTQRIKIRSDGRLPSGGLPFHLMDGLPLSRGDLHGRVNHCRDVFRCDRGEARARPECYNTGPPGWRIRLPASGADCRGSTLPKHRKSHPERSRCVFCCDRGEARAGPERYDTGPPGWRTHSSAIGADCRGSTLPFKRICHPDADSSSEGSEPMRCYQILRPDKLGLRMNGALWWSPPGRNGPMGSSPPKHRKSHPERCRFLTSEGSDRRVYGHPDVTLVTEGSDKCALYQTLRPDEPGLRMTGTLWWSPPQKTLRHRERCPDKVGTSVAICQTRSEPGSGCHVPYETGLAMTIRRRWSPPGRKGPMSRDTFSKRNSRPDADLSAGGSDQCRTSRIFCLDKSGLRLTNNSADEKQCSVKELCDEKKFSRSNGFGTPSFSPTANRTEDLFTINTFS
jgi:hypothetical protein